MATASELLDRWVSSFNKGQMESFEAFMAPTAITDEIGTGRRLGVKEGTEAAKAWKASFPDAQGEIVNCISSGNQAAAEIIWTGTNSGTLNSMPATGKAVRVRAIAVLLEDGGRTAQLRHYIDIAGMREQLEGRVPAAG